MIKLALFNAPKITGCRNEGTQARSEDIVPHKRDEKEVPVPIIESL